jgi:hypothetical protein
LALAYGSFAVLTSPGMKVKLSNVLLTFQLFVRRRQCNFNRSKSCVKATYGLHGAFQTVFLSLQIVMKPSCLGASSSGAPCSFSDAGPAASGVSSFVTSWTRIAA